MYYKKMLTILIGLIVAGLFAISALPAANIGLMTKEELKTNLSNENIVILDVRTGQDWSSSEFKIKGAVRAEPGKIKTWSSTLDKGKTVVLYCA